MTASRRALVTAAVATLLVAGSACEYDGASSLPLPGGAGDGGYEVRMVFDDVANLVPKETCRAGDVVVGSVVSIDLREDLTAEVVCRIDPDVRLAGNAVATLRETSLLGERFVALDPPPGQEPTGTLEADAEIAQSDTRVVPDVEIVFGALSQVLNGGGLAHVETISRELSVALGEADLGATTDKLTTLVATLNDNRNEIVEALEAVGRLSAVLADQRGVIATALESVPAGLAVLERQRPAFVATLGQLRDLSAVAVPLIERAKADTVADLAYLGPILEDLARSKERLAAALEVVTTFPFPTYTQYVSQGDYAGMFGTFNLDLDSLNKALEAHLPVEPPVEPPTDDQGNPQLPTPPVPEIDLQDLVDQLPELQLSDLDELGLGGLAEGLGLGRPSAADRVQGHTSAEPPRSLAELLTGGAE